MYQIFPDRFNRSKDFTPLVAKNEEERIKISNWNATPLSRVDDENYSAKDFFMGNIQGIIEKKDYLNRLNIDCIYLNPIFESSENHGYSTANYFKVDPYLGENESLKKLCCEFKKIGTNIILDGVFSHTGSDSIYFNKYNRYDEIGAYNSMESRYYPWFNFIDYPENYASWWGFDNLPELKKENEDYMNFIFNNEDGVLNYWQDIGIKGWRLDVADELPDVFLDRLRISVKSKDPESFILGEVWEDASNKISYGNRRRYLQGNQLDSVMNYPFRNYIIEFLKTGNSGKFLNSIIDIVSNYPKESLDCMMNALSTHDTERILTVLGTDELDISFEDKKNFRLTDKEYKDAIFLEKFASFLQFTLPGIPSIYYGDEIGMQGFSDPYNRACFDYSLRNQDLLDHYEKLCDFRKKYRSSFSTGFSFLNNDLNFKYKNLVSYLRNDIFCIVNLGSHPVIFDEIKTGDWVFGNKKPVFTDYGLVIAPMSFTAVKIYI